MILGIAFARDPARSMSVYYLAVESSPGGPDFVLFAALLKY
jgi:hypothetical protein